MKLRRTLMMITCLFLAAGSVYMVFYSSAVRAEQRPVVTYAFFGGLALLAAFAFWIRRGAED